MGPLTFTLTTYMVTQVLNGNVGRALKELTDKVSDKDSNNKDKS